MVAFLAPTPTGAAETTLQAAYAVSIAGLTIGTAEAESRFTDTDYAAIIKGRTSGISRLVSDGEALLIGSGRISGTRLLPTSYDLETSEGDFETHVRMKMQAGAITDLLVIPRLREHPDRIPVEPEHTRDVVDPVAAFLIVADDTENAEGPSVCARTIKVFDGWQRYDVMLSYKQTRTVKGGNDTYAGRAVVCAARYVPVAGHRMSLSATRYMSENERLEVWYVPVGERPLLVPYRILIGTVYGDLVIAATRFVVTDATAKSPVSD